MFVAFALVLLNKIGCNVWERENRNSGHSFFLKVTRFEQFQKLTVWKNPYSFPLGVFQKIINDKTKQKITFFFLTGWKNHSTAMLAALLGSSLTVC